MRKPEIENTKIKKRSAMQFLMMQLCVFTGIVMSSVLHAMSQETTIRFFFFQLSLLFLPGYALLLLLKKRQNDLVGTMALSYALGLFLLIIQYLTSIITGIPSIVCALVIEIATIAVVVRKRPETGEFCTDNGNVVFLAVLILLLYLVCLFSISAANTFSIENGNANISDNDYMYWVANTVALSKTFPPSNPRLFGTQLQYHYFSSIIVAQTARITGISIQVLSFYFSYIIPVFMLVLSAFYLAESIIRSRFLQFIAVTGILLTEGTSLTYAHHLYYCSFGFDYGLFFGMLAIGWLLRMMTVEDISLLSTITAAVLIFMVTGCKGPVALVVLLGYGIFGVQLLTKKEYKSAIIAGILWLGVFFLVFFVFLGGFQKSTGSGGLQFVGIIEGGRLNHWIQYNYNQLKEQFGMEGLIGKGLSVILYVVNINLAAILGLVLSIGGLLYQVMRKKSVDIFLLILTAISIWGILLTLVTYQDGSSQMYFAMVTIPMGIISGLYSIGKFMNKKRVLCRILMTVQLLCIAIGICIFTIGPGKKVFGTQAYYGQMFQKMQQGRIILNNGRGYGVTIEEYEAYDWIKKNTPPKAVFAIDKSNRGDPNYQELIVFGEKYVWNDGMYNRTGEIERRNRMLEEIVETSDVEKELGNLGIDYLLVPYNSVAKANISSQCNLVFSNQEYSVYRIK